MVVPGKSLSIYDKGGLARNAMIGWPRFLTLARWRRWALGRVNHSTDAE
jgi:hypothetical protein